MRYKLVFNLETDRALTRRELDHLTDSCLAQVEDPADSSGKGKRASFTVLHVAYSGLKVGGKRYDYETRAEIVNCQECGELLTLCACLRCQDCEELTPSRVAGKRCECGGRFY